jgi:hypothetical protein
MMDTKPMMEARPLELIGNQERSDDAQASLEGCDNKESD